MPSAKILSISCSRLDLRRAVKVLAVEKNNLILMIKKFAFNSYFGVCLKDACFHDL